MNFEEGVCIERDGVSCERREERKWGGRGVMEPRVEGRGGVCEKNPDFFVAERGSSVM